MRKNIPLVLILIVAFLLRFIGTNPSYNQYHSDEGVTYSAAVSMIKNGNLDPLRYDYPTLVPLVNYLFFRFGFIPVAWGNYYLTHISQIIDGTVHIPIAPLEASKIFQVSILGEREINALFWGRYVTAFISLGNVFLVYLLGKKLFNQKIALLVSLLLAVSFKAVVNSHIGLPDTYNAFFLLLSLIFSYRITEDHSAKNYLLAGVFLGLSVSTKFQIFGALPLLVSHIYASLSDRKNLFSPKLLLAGIVALGVFIFLNPYHFVYYEETIDILSYVSKKYGMGRMQLMTYPFSYLANIDYGWPIFLAVLVGIGFSIKKFTKQSLFLMSAVLPFFFVMVYYSGGGFYVRNFITITPILLVFAAVLLSLFSRRLLFLVLPAIILIPLGNSLVNGYYYTKPWTYKEILIKSQKLLPEGSKVASHPFDPLPPTVERVSFERSLSYSLSEFRELGADYALINMDWASGDFYGWMTKSYPSSLSYFKKPIDQMRGTFSGQTIEEMIPFTVASSFKPWQAPDAALFLIKIPSFKDVEFTNSETIKLDDELGIKPGFAYRVSGFLKMDDLIAKNQREVFLKIDFFDGPPALDGKRVYTSVSSRYYGDDWRKVELVTVAPQGANAARVSLQTYGDTLGNYYVKDILVEESSNLYKIESDYEEIDFSQYRDLLYPNSHGNL